MLAGSALGALGQAPGFAGGDGTSLPPGCAVTLAHARATQSSAVLESRCRKTSSCPPVGSGKHQLENELAEHAHASYEHGYDMRFSVSG